MENFIGLPTGTKVPSAYYDREKAAWIPTPDGKVVEIIAINAGTADLDTTGDGVNDNGSGIGVTPAERQELASLYNIGDTLWRVPLTHLSPLIIIFRLPHRTMPKILITICRKIKMRILHQKDVDSVVATSKIKCSRNIWNNRECIESALFQRPGSGKANV